MGVSGGWMLHAMHRSLGPEVELIWSSGFILIVYKPDIHTGSLSFMLDKITSLTLVMKGTWGFITHL